MVIDPATGVIEWTPDTVGSYTVTVTARNSEGTDSQTFTVDVAEAPNFPGGVVSYWKLDETAGSVYFDANMIADGQCAADCPQPAVGQVDGGQTFDGSSEINVAPDTLFDRGFGESFSVEFWMRKATDTGGNEPALARDDKSSKVHWWAGVGHTVERGKARFYVRDRAGNGFGVSGTTVLTDAAWHHVVAVQDGAAAELRIYVDGNLEGTTPTSYSSDFIAPTAKLTIGWLDIGLHFNGDLDEAAFYSRSLTQEEIDAHYYNGVTGYGYFEENNFVPTIISVPPARIISNTLYTYDVASIGFPVPEYTLDGEPAGMVIDPATGVIEWTPDTVGSYSVTVTARNSEGTDSQTFTVDVAEAPNFPGGVVSYWRLDETAGSVYFDANMIADGQCAASCPQPAVGLVDGGQTFDGSSEINVAPDTLFDRGFGESFSVEFWMRKATDTGGNEPALARDDKSSKVHWWAGVGHTVERGKARFYVRDRAGNGFGVSGTTVLTDAAWHHVVAVQDGAAAELRIYVDGNLEGTTPTSYSSDFIAPTAKLTIGWLDIGLHFNGDLDEAAFYSRSLTQEEIDAHYYNGVTGYGYFEENNFAPTIISVPPARIISNSLYTYDVASIGFPAPEYTLDGEPAGMVIDPATGVIEWTPDTVGSYSVTVTARNSEGTDSQTFTVDVAEAPNFPGGVVSYWRLDETAGSVYFDANMIADGQCGASCPQPAVGLVDGGQTFDGSSEINVAPDTLFDRGFGESFSVEFWMRKATDTGGNEPALARDDKSSKVHWWAGVGHTVERGKARFYVRDRAGNGFGVSGTTVLTDAAWHHVVAVQDGAAAELRIYVDGNLEGTTPTSYSSDFIAPTAKLTIGWLDIGLHFNGDLDEAAFYSRSLTQEEIDAHYYNGVAGYAYF